MSLRDPGVKRANCWGVGVVPASMLPEKKKSFRVKLKLRPELLAQLGKEKAVEVSGVKTVPKPSVVAETKRRAKDHQSQEKSSAENVKRRKMKTTPPRNEGDPLASSPLSSVPDEETCFDSSLSREFDTSITTNASLDSIDHHGSEINMLPGNLTARGPRSAGIRPVKARLNNKVDLKMQEAKTKSTRKDEAVEAMDVSDADGEFEYEDTGPADTSVASSLTDSGDGDRNVE